MTTKHNLKPMDWDYVTVDADGKEFVVATPSSPYKSEVDKEGARRLKQMIDSGCKPPAKIFLRPSYHVTLYRVIDGRYELTAGDIDQLVALLTFRCRENTKARVRSVLTYGLHRLESCGIFEQVYAEAKGDEDFKWQYCAGQCYVSELKTVRELIVR